MITRSRRSAPHGQSAVAPTRLETATTVSTGASQPDGEDQDMNTAAGERTGSHHIGVVRGLQSILELAADVKFMSIVMHLYQGDSSLAILPRLFQLSDTVKIVNKSSDGGIGLRTALTGAVRDHGKGYDGSSTTHYQLIKPFITHYLGLRKRERNDLPDGDGEQSELLRLITERCKVLLQETVWGLQDFQCAHLGSRCQAAASSFSSSPRRIVCNRFQSVTRPGTEDRVEKGEKRFGDSTALSG